ncbi:hypothetical protein AA313_de0200130 [Arthrobotrys entomopaga]|nr:hypothetical protein AA313_de0200130 [Arthrobotrys entomopaga]
MTTLRYSTARTAVILAFTRVRPNIFSRFTQSRTLAFRHIFKASSERTSSYATMPRGRKKLETLPPDTAANTQAHAPVVSNIRRPVRTASSKAVDYAVDQPSPNSDILDGENALRASPSAAEDRAFSPTSEEEEELPIVKKITPTKKAKIKAKAKTTSKSTEISVSKAKKSTPKKRKAAEALVSDEDFDCENGEDESVERPPAVNDDYRPIPFKGRLGFACLNTYLRSCNIPVFCSRTCRIDTILKHDKESGPGAGLTYLKSLGFANATDLSTLIRWNQKYNIKFLRISSEMFPFASHAEYAYDLAHAAEPLKEAGRLAMEYGHRLTMHPGQFTQLGSPRKEVVENAIRDLEYHCELLDRLQLIGQADKDAVMIIHMGGIFGDKGATLDRFRDVYTTRLSEGIKRRLVLENDDVCWSVEDLLPICQEFGIPLVLDWHHNNIIHGELREGTYDVKKIYGDAIKKTWTDKGITQKQHYSEPRAGSVTNKERRRHSPRVMEMPPCEDTMDLMIEAKDKEQAVFELMRRFKLDGWEKIADVVPYERSDENKVETKKKKKVEEEELEVVVVPPEEVGMGGNDNRVYWPEGMEEYLRPMKKTRAKKEEAADEEENPAKKSNPKKAVKVEEAPKSQKAVKKAKKDIIVENGDLLSSEAPSKTSRATKVKAKKKVAAMKTYSDEDEAVELQLNRETLIQTNGGILEVLPAPAKRGRKTGASKKQKVEEATEMSPRRSTRTRK